jgi:hypothetical protein
MTTEPPPTPNTDVTDGSVDLGGPRVAVPPVTSVLTRVRALWCAFVTGLG